MSVEEKSNELLAALRKLPNELENAAALVNRFMYLAKESEGNASVILKVGLVPVLVNTVKQYSSDAVGRTALVVLDNLAIFPITHEALLEADSLGVSLSLLENLRSTDNKELDLGLSAAFLICRTVGKHESGPGPAAISGNPILIEKIKWLLESVYTSTGDSAIGYVWDPTNIMMDISTLATSDRNKPLLVGFASLITNSMIKWRFRYPKLLTYAIHALSQLFFEPACRKDFIECKEALSKFLGELTAEELDRETNKNLSSLSNSIAALGAPGKPPAGAAARKLSAATKKTGVLGRMLGGKASTAAATDGGGGIDGHVMISYQWDAQDIARGVHEALVSANMKTWIDVNDMGANIFDSMAYAVENAWAIVVLVSRKYKESPNCRKECEMADGMSKPILFVKVEDYDPEAWLRLVMGKALWIDCTTSSKVPAATSQIVKRVGEVGQKAGKVEMGPQPRRASFQVQKAPSPSRPDASQTGDANTLALLNKILANIETLQTDVNELRAEVRALKPS